MTSTTVADRRASASPAWRRFMGHGFSGRRGVRDAVQGVSLLGAVLAGGLLWGGDDVVVEEGEAATRQQFQTISLDQQMRGMLGNGRDEVDGIVEQKALGQLELEIARIDETCGLTEDQRAKLEMAARLESARAAERFDGMKRRYSGRTVDLQTQEGQKEWQRFHQEMSAVQRVVPRAGSVQHLVGRAVWDILDDRQRVAWDEESDLRQASQWRRMVDAGVMPIESLAGLTTRQHEALVAILVENAPRIDLAKAREMFGDQNPIVCFYVLSRLDQARLESIFEARQWERIRNVIRQGEAWRPTIESMQLIGE